MKFLDYLSTALRNLWLNRSRSLLTILGIVIGVSAVIGVIGFGEGHREIILREMDKVGADLLWVTMDMENYYSKPKKEQICTQDSFTMADIKEIVRLCPAVKAAAPLVTFSGTFRYLNKHSPFSLLGTTPSYFYINRLTLIRGRFLSEFDVKAKRRVCVLEDSIATRKLFGLANPVGKGVLISQRRFKVVGLIKEKKIRGESEEGRVILPISTLERIRRMKKIDLLYAQANSSSLVEKASNQTTQVLSVRHRKKRTKFVTCSLVATLKSAQTVNRTTTMALIGIAAISLLVGGIGIMNVMLVSVMERIKEIGLRRAVGASRKDIQLLFLIEASSLSSIGGILGLLVGMAGVVVAAPFFKIPVAIPFWAPLLGFSFSLVIGILSGVYPAERASNLHPIEALRHE